MGEWIGLRGNEPGGVSVSSDAWWKCGSGDGGRRSSASRGESPAFWQLELEAWWAGDRYCLGLLLQPGPYAG